MSDVQTIWITGASSGIGKALCLHYQQTGFKVIASSRNNVDLQEAFATYSNIFCLPCDVSDEADVHRAATIIEQRFSNLSHVCVNAGLCEYVDVMPIDVAQFQKILNVNVIGAVNTVNAALPLLHKTATESGINGHIIAMGSQVIFAPFTRSEMYGASKAALNYLMQSWRLDLAESAIDVSIIHPGFVDTPLTRKNSFSMPFLQTPEQAAIKIATAVAKRKRSFVFPKRLYATLLLSRIFPQFWQTLMLKGQRAELLLPTHSNNMTSKQDDA